MKNVPYGIGRTLSGVDVNQVEQRVIAALKEVGFGVITEIDVKKTIKEKLNEDVRPYKILGACNPSFAHKALAQEPMIGLLLPCNVILFENRDGSIEVSAINPDEMFKIVDLPIMKELATEVKERLTKAINSL